jgi:hypothetical protein
MVRLSNHERLAPFKRYESIEDDEQESAKDMNRNVKEK